MIGRMKPCDTVHNCTMHMFVSCERRVIRQLREEAYDLLLPNKHHSDTGSVFVALMDEEQQWCWGKVFLKETAVVALSVPLEDMVAFETNIAIVPRLETIYKQAPMVPQAI